MTDTHTHELSRRDVDTLVAALLVWQDYLAKGCEQRPGLAAGFEQEIEEARNLVSRLRRADR